MINGDIDLTDNLDFYHDKKLPSIKKKIPWKNKNKFDFTIKNNISYTNDFIDNTFYMTSTIDNDYIYYIDNLSTTTNTSYITNNISYNININYYNNGVTNTCIIHGTDKMHPSTSIPNNDIFGYKRKNKKCKNISKIYCRVCKKSHYLGKCRENSIKSSKLFFKKPYIINSCDALRELLRSRKAKCKNKATNKSNRKIPWLRNLPPRVYNDYINDLFEEQDYSSYLTNTGWLGIH